MHRHIGIHYLTHPKHLFLTLALIAGGVLGFAYSIEAYPEVFKIEIKAEKTTSISPNEAVSFNFSSPVISENYGNEIKITPSVDAKIFWENGNKKIVIRPDKFWQPETEYRVSFPDGRSAMLTKVEAQEISFSTIKYPKVAGIFPQNGAKDVMIDIEDPITVDFDKSTELFFIKFTLDPEMKMTFQNNSEKTQFKLLPEKKTQNGNTYTIKISAKYVGDNDNNYKEIYSSSFGTPPLPRESWEKDYSARLSQARKFTQAQISSGKYIDINLASQILSTFEDGKLLDSYLISAGKRGMETPKGTHKVMSKRIRPWSKKYGLYMPWFMQFTGQGHGIHELPEWPGGYKEGANHLGIPVSHGCVRLGIGPAKTVFDWADAGTPVMVY